MLRRRPSSRGLAEAAAVATPTWEPPLTERVEDARAFLRLLRTHLISAREKRVSQLRKGSEREEVQRTELALHRHVNSHVPQDVPDLADDLRRKAVRDGLLVERSLVEPELVRRESRDGGGGSGGGRSLSNDRGSSDRGGDGRRGLVAEAAVVVARGRTRRGLRLDVGGGRSDDEGRGAVGVGGDGSGGLVFGGRGSGRSWGDGAFPHARVARRRSLDRRQRPRWCCGGATTVVKVSLDGLSGSGVGLGTLPPEPIHDGLGFAVRRRSSFPPVCLEVGRETTAG